MKVRIFSEDTPDGQAADWPVIPNKGEVVSYKHRGGTSNLGVRERRWQVDTDGQFIEVEIHLTY